MPRKQIILDDRHERFLKDASAQSGISEGHLVRQALDLLMSRVDHGAQDQAMRAREAADLVALLRRAAASAAPDRPVVWSRQEAYADRGPRWTR